VRRTALHLNNYVVHERHARHGTVIRLAKRAEPDSPRGRIFRNHSPRKQPSDKLPNPSSIFFFEWHAFSRTATTVLQRLSCTTASVFPVPCRSMRSVILLQVQTLNPVAGTGAVLLGIIHWTCLHAQRAFTLDFWSRSTVLVYVTQEVKTCCTP
jgi:hypothetical protein